MRALSVIDALSNINAITKVVEKSGDDQIVRATNTQLKTDKDVKTYFYVRTSKIDQLWQKLTDWTDGAKAKQALAKRLIISNLKTIINNNDFDKNFPDAEKRKEARANIEKIIATLEGVDKDITASMIKNDLTSLKGFFNSYETAEKKYDNFNRSPKSIQEAQDESLNDDQNFVAVSFQDSHAAEDTTITQDSFNLNPLYESKRQNPLYRGKSKELDPAKSVASDAATAASPLVNAASSKVITASPPVEKNVSESDIDFLVKQLGYDADNLDQKKALSEIAKAVVNETENDLDSAVFKPFWIEANAESEKNYLLFSVKDALKQASQGMSNHVISVDVAELVFNSEDPEVEGSPYKESNSQPAESTPTINTTPSPIGEAIEQDIDATEVATKSIPSPTPSATSSKAETKSTAKANPYLESLKTEWDPADDGYHTITKPFFITGGIPTSSMIAEAYLLPVSKQLNFAEEGSVVSSGREGDVIQGKHILHKHGDTDTQRDTRPYLKLSAKGPNSILVGASKVAKNETIKQQMLNQFKTDLFETYIDSFTKINEEYKKINSGRELETLVIVPISGLPGVLTEVESVVLASAVLAIQNENPDLKIHVSAAEINHENRIRSAYEEKIKDLT